MVLMRGYNLCFYGERRKIVVELSSDNPFIDSSVIGSKVLAILILYSLYIEVIDRLGT